jgi:hypothetical protein
VSAKGGQYVTQDRALNSVFHQASSNSQVMGVMQEFDLRDLVFPGSQLGDDPSIARHYGSDHALQTSLLAVECAKLLGVLKPEDQRVVRTVAYFHDYGRREPWTRPDPGHNIRSADETVRVLSGRVNGHGDRDFIHEVARLIAAHDPLGAKPSDPRLLAVREADLLESARLEPNTVEGLKVFKARAALCMTELGLNREHRVTWLKHRGWR